MLWYDRLRNAALQLALVLVVVGALDAWVGGPVRLYGMLGGFAVGAGVGLSWWARR